MQLILETMVIQMHIEIPGKYVYNQSGLRGMIYLNIGNEVILA